MDRQDKRSKSKYFDHYIMGRSNSQVETIQNLESLFLKQSREDMVEQLNQSESV